MGGGARGAGGLDTTLIALVPQQVGLTTRDQPVLFWYQSKPANAKLELTLIQPGTPKPLMVVVSPSARPGIHRIRLANHSVKLAVNVDYQWAVSLIPDPSSRSLDVVAKGTVKRVEPSKELARLLTASSPAELPAIYAQAGIWYDALEAISDEIDAHPDDKALRSQRAELLKQVGLPAIE